MGDKGIPVRCCIHALYLARQLVTISLFDGYFTKFGKSPALLEPPRRDCDGADASVALAFASVFAEIERRFEALFDLLGRLLAGGFAGFRGGERIDYRLRLASRQTDGP